MANRPKFSMVSSTKARIIDIDAKEFDDLYQYLEDAKDCMYRATDTVVAKMGKEGRKGGSEYEKSEAKLSFGSHRIYSRGGLRQTKSYWDNSLGGFRTPNHAKNKDGKDYRLSNFKYTEHASKRSEGHVKSEAYLTSNIANLFENDVRWEKANSPKFTFGKSNRPGKWIVGVRDERPGRHYFEKFVSAIIERQSVIKDETVKDYDKYMEKKRKGKK